MVSILAIKGGHVIFINRQFSNGWIRKCSCGELFTGKGTFDTDNKTSMHTFLGNGPTNKPQS
jgi:hypothetical protein